MKIGLLTYGLDRPLSGIGRYTVELAKALMNLKNGPEVILLCAGPAGPLQTENFRNTTLPGCRLLPGLMTLGNILIPWKVNRLDLDLVHDPIGVAPFLFGAGRAKMVVTLHDVLPWSFPGTSTRLENLIYRRWLPHTIQRVHAIITPSRQSRADILRFLPVKPDRLEVIPYGLATAFHRLPEKSFSMHLQQRFGISQGFILYVGSDVPRKNIDRLIMAFAKLAEEFPLLRLILAGPRKEIIENRGGLRGLGNTSNRILWTGPLTDMDLPSLYNGCELFVFPSLYEGFGLPPLEAMACGAPVVCSDTSSLPEVVDNAAWLVNSLDTSALAAAMRELLVDSSLREELRKKGLERASAFSWERNATETMDVYRKVVYH